MFDILKLHLRERAIAYTLVYAGDICDDVSPLSTMHTLSRSSEQNGQELAVVTVAVIRLYSIKINEIRWTEKPGRRIPSASISIK